MSLTPILILDQEDVKKKLRRIAYQIYENNFQEKELVIAGISDRGYNLAQVLSSLLEDISGLKIQLISLTIDKKNPAEKNIVLEPKPDIKNKTVIIVDDVLNTGKTLVYSMLPFLKEGAKKIQTCILMDRNHKVFPVSADYVGMSLATTLKEHISVEIGKKKDVKVFLS